MVRDQELDAMQQALCDHPLYDHLQTLADLRVFMQHHVFAVWDFMSLAKRLQQALSGWTVPWIPAQIPGHYTRLIHEIMLDEESDDDGQGGVASHFQLYLAAMREIEADTAPILTYCETVRQGADPFRALEHPKVPPAVRPFVRCTLEIACSAPVHVVAAAFFFGREAIIPGMFTALVRQWRTEGLPVERLAYYLHRHIAVDGDRHGPRAAALVNDLCGDDEQAWQAVQTVAKHVLQQRLTLWDQIADQLSKPR